MKTIVYFHSGACPSCEQMLPLGERLAAEQFDVHAVPSFKVFNEDGRLVSVDSAAKDLVRELMREGGIVRN